MAEIAVSATVERVKVYLNTADVTMGAQVEVPAGLQTLVIGGLTTLLSPASLKVEGKGAGAVRHVSYRDYTRTTKNDGGKEAMRLSALADETRRKMEDIVDEEFILEQALQFIASNQKLGEMRHAGPDDIEKVSTFYNARVTELKRTLRKLEREQKELKKLYEQYALALQNTGQEQGERLRAAILQYESPVAGPLHLYLSFLTVGAGWVPKYDIEVENTSEPPVLKFRAELSNETGMDWLGVKLALSTAIPNERVSAPLFREWPLTIDDSIDIDMDLSPLDAPMYSMSSIGTTADFTHVQSSTLAVEYIIDTPTSVPAGPTPLTLDVQELRPGCVYEHFAIPNIDETVYLRAKLTGWEALNLLPGTATLQFEKNYVGETRLAPAAGEPDLLLSLGKDKRVLVQHKSVKRDKSKSFLGNSIKQDFLFETTLQNTKSGPIKLVLEGSVPVSENKEIEVKLGETTGATLDAAQGKLSWTLTLAAGEIKKLRYGFEVKYPKAAKVIGLVD